MIVMPPGTPPNVAQSEGFAAQLMQLAPAVKGVLDKLKPLVDQPVIRFPYELPLARTQTIAAGQTGFRLPDTDFIHALEWPFEIKKIKFSNDPSHTFRDWRITIKDQSFNQEWSKTSAMVATIINDNTAAYELEFPWIVRPKGGGITVTVDNLDTQNPINVDLNFVGYLLIPRA